MVYVNAVAVGPTLWMAAQHAVNVVYAFVVVRCDVATCARSVSLAGDAVNVDVVLGLCVLTPLNWMCRGNRHWCYGNCHLQNYT